MKKADATSLPASDDQPEGWASCILPDIADLIMGQSPPGKTYNDDGKGLPFFQGKADFRERHPVVRKWCSAPTKIAEAGDVLMSIRAPVGPTNVADQTCANGRGLAAIRPTAATSTEFLLFALRLQEQSLAEQGTGSTFTAINRDHLNAIEIRLPPLAEQKRIVAKVEELLARVNAARERLAKAPAILKRFRQSVLAAACSGQLTAEWREDHGKDGDWRTTTLCDVGSVRGGITKNPHRATLPLQVPYLRVANVYENRLCLTEVLKIGVTPEEYERTVLKPGDLLFVEGNGSIDQIGRVAMWDGAVSRCVHQNHLIRFTAGDRVIPAYVLYWMMGSQGRSQLIDKAISSAGLHSLSISKVSEVELEVPDSAEQREIVRRVEALFALSDKIEARVQAATARVEKITQAILANAFRGELVPTEAELARAEGRDYEPASVLLERIRAEREKTGSESTARPRRRTTQERRSHRR